MPADVREVHEQLQRALELRGMLAAPVASLHRRRSYYESSFWLEEITVASADGRRFVAMFKDVSPEGMSEAASLAKSAIQHEPLRELRTYERILAPAGIGPGLLGTVEDAPGGRYWLFVEKVDGVELYQVGEVGEWQKVARWLAVMHARFAGQIETFLGSVPLVDYGPAMFTGWLRDARQSEARAVRRLGARVAPLLRTMLAELGSWPDTLVHGDFYPSNIIVATAAAGRRRVLPVDWEMAGYGPGLLDLAALTAGWYGAESEAMAASYYGAWARCRPRAPGYRAFTRALDCCRLLLALRLLAAPVNWRPPEAHVQDWLAEASRAAERLSTSIRNGGPGPCEHL